MKHILIALLLTAFQLAYSSEAIPLWEEGKTPYQKEIDQQTGSPQLVIYPAADDNRNGAAVVICPGGGYGGLARDHEGHQIAKWYHERGVAAFVLYYRLGKEGHHFPTQLADVQRALRLVRGNAEKWKIDPARIGVMGFSAGGHLASMAATKFNEKAYEPVDEIDKTVSARPDFAVLCYAVISMDSQSTHKGSLRNLLGPEKVNDPEAVRHVSSEKNITKDTPPTFLFHTDEDSAVPPENSILFYLGLKKHKIPSELHIYQHGPHGVGLYEGDPILGTWSGHLEDWLRANGFFTNGFKRAAVSGSVTLDGQPVSWGTITFHPKSENLPVVTSRVRRGKFSTKAASGPVVGDATVSFSGSIWEATGKDEDEYVELRELKPGAGEISVEVTEGAVFEWAFETK